MDLRSWSAYSLKAENKQLSNSKLTHALVPTYFVIPSHIYHLVYTDIPLKREYIIPIWPEDQAASIPNYRHFLINIFENLIIKL